LFSCVRVSLTVADRFRLQMYRDSWRGSWGEGNLGTLKVFWVNLSCFSIGSGL
jgi:hypothetical protein